MVLYRIRCSDRLLAVGRRPARTQRAARPVGPGGRSARSLGVGSRASCHSQGLRAPRRTCRGAGGAACLRGKPRCHDCYNDGSFPGTFRLFRSFRIIDRPSYLSTVANLRSNCGWPELVACIPMRPCCPVRRRGAGRVALSGSAFSLPACAVGGTRAARGDEEEENRRRVIGRVRRVRLLSFFFVA